MYKKLTILLTALIIVSVLVACTPETIIETVEVEVPVDGDATSNRLGDLDI